ncbi:MAG TPA: ATP-binding protein [Verrucomicrobiae bacterium]|nr:ATP-binding protein [Verrucomicrobiae bacterium]
MAAKSNFLDKVLGRIGRLDAHGLQTVVRRLARERDFLETLFNIIEDGVLVLDENGRILYFNQAVTKLLGLQQGAEGQTIERYLPELEWEKLAALDRAGGPGVARHEFEVNYPRPRVISLYAAPLDGEATGSSGLALILHDATEARLKTFEAIESERMQALTLLAASVAHEIGNPLNALHIHLQLIERELRNLKSKDTGKIQNYVGAAKGEIARLDYIVRQFLDAIRPTAPKFVLSQLNDVVRATIELLRPEIDNRGIVFEQKLLRQLPQVRMDPAQIQQALVNLVRNALQAMTKGGVLRLQTGQSSENVWVSVADTGSGIPADHVKRIFEPFYTTKKKGSGLGLMIVQRIVRDHGGGIELESRVDEGSTFRIWLPLHERGPRLLAAGDAPAAAG